MKAKDKRAAFGLDIDLDNYTSEGKHHSSISNLADLHEDQRKDCLGVGFDTSEEGRSGSFIQLDHSVLFSRSKVEGLEVTDIDTAIKIHDGLKDHLWQALPVDQDKYTAHAVLRPTGGYFIRAMPRAKAVFPLQACLFIGEDKVAQNVHNVIVAEEDSELHIVTGCSVSSHVSSALHIGVSEFYVKRNAKITFTMIHKWAGSVDVRPRTGIVVEDNGTYISNYICLHPVKSLQTYPTAFLRGFNAKATFQSILYASEDSMLDVGSGAYLQGSNSRVQMIGRAIAKDKAKVTVRGRIIGEAAPSRGHLECRGLMLSDSAIISAMPELDAKNSGAELSHEAAVGKILEEEILYLTTRGLSEEEATSVMISGFMNIDIEGLPPQLGNDIRRLLRLSVSKL